MTLKGYNIDPERFYLGFFVYVNVCSNNCYGIIQLIEERVPLYEKINLAFASKKYLGESNAKEFAFKFQPKEFELKFQANDFAIFKLNVSENSMFRFEAYDIFKPSEKVDYLKEKFENLPYNSSIKWLCLGLDENFLLDYIERETQMWKNKIAIIEEVLNYKTKETIKNNLNLEIETGGRWKPGDDDSMSAYLKSKFIGFEGKEHSYLEETFGYNQMIYSDREYKSYKLMIEEYLKSKEYENHKNQAIEIKKFILKEIDIRYSLNKHKSTYLKICNEMILTIEKSIKEKVVPNEWRMKNNEW